MVSPRRHWTGAGALVFAAVRDARSARRIRPLAPLRAPLDSRRRRDAVRRLQLVTNAARFARMDTLCVALTLGSVFTYLYALDRTRLSLFGLCGVLAVLAFLSHPLGIVAIAVVSVHLLTCTTRTDHRGAAACWLAGGFSC